MKNTILLILVLFTFASAAQKYIKPFAPSGDSSGSSTSNVADDPQRVLNALTFGDTVNICTINRACSVTVELDLAIQTPGESVRTLIRGRNQDWSADSLAEIIAKGTPAYLLDVVGKLYYVFQYIKFTGGATGQVYSSVSCGVYGGPYFWRCVFQNSSGGAIVTSAGMQSVVVDECVFINNAGIAAQLYYGKSINSKYYGNGGVAVSLAEYADGNLFYENSTTAISNANTVTPIYTHNTIHKTLANDAITITALDGHALITHNRISNGKKHAIGANSVDKYHLEYGNSFWANDSGNYDKMDSSTWNGSTMETELPYTDTSADNYTIKTTAAHRRQQINLDWNLATSLNKNFVSAGALTPSDSTVICATGTFPARTKVLTGIQYGTAPTDSTGLFVSAPRTKTAKGYTYGVSNDSTGTLNLPPIIYVKTGTSYALTDSTGSYICPAGTSTRPDGPYRDRGFR